MTFFPGSGAHRDEGKQKKKLCILLHENINTVIYIRYKYFFFLRNGAERCGEKGAAVGWRGICRWGMRGPVEWRGPRFGERVEAVSLYLNLTHFSFFSKSPLSAFQITVVASIYLNLIHFSFFHTLDHFQQQIIVYMPQSHQYQLHRYSLSQSTPSF
jgi:hypothetical protein